jgi:hypothetical protein
MFKEKRMDWLHEIARCPNIQHCYKAPTNSHPCSKIISVQPSYPHTLSQHQVAEPWSGDIEHAPILFLSSNPSIDEKEEFPLWSWSDEHIVDFFTHRYKGGRKQWIKEGTYFLQRDGLHSRRSVNFWASVRKRAKELLEKDIEDGVDYALTEVVHCKSRKEIGVEDALPECSRLYLRPVIALSGAKVIVVLGKQAAKVVRSAFGIPNVNMFGPQLISSHQRYFVFLPHPNAHVPRTFEKVFDKEDLQELRDFLRPK